MRKLQHHQLSLVRVSFQHSTPAALTALQQNQSLAGSRLICCPTSVWHRSLQWQLLRFAQAKQVDSARIQRNLERFLDRAPKARC